MNAGVALCRAAGAKALAGTHHHIRHTDAMLDIVDAELRRLLPGSFMAREGQIIRLERTRTQARENRPAREKTV